MVTRGGVDGDLESRHRILFIELNIQPGSAVSLVQWLSRGDTVSSAVWRDTLHVLGGELSTEVGMTRKDQLRGNLEYQAEGIASAEALWLELAWVGQHRL